MNELLMLTLVCPPELDEKLLDQLLITCPDAVFTSQAIACHGVTKQLLNPAEQVMGRSRSVQVQILLSPPEIDTLMSLLRTEFKGVGVRYWLSPVMDSGEIE